MTGLSISDLQSALKSGLVKRLRILLGALAASSLVYGVVGILFVKNAQPSSQGVDPVFMICLGVVAIGEAFFSWWLPEKILRSTNFERLFDEGLNIPKQNRITKDRGEII